MRKILLVEDDVAVREPFAAYLREQGLTVVTAGSTGEADKLTDGVSLAVVDWNLPDGEGPDLIRSWRARGLAFPAILPTARAELVDRVSGLEGGAVDYVTKPFEPREVLARIRAHLRESQGASSKKMNQSLEVDDLRMDFTTRSASYKGRKLELTKMEFDLLKALFESPGRVFSREELLNLVWGFESYPSTRTVDTHVLQLRQKMDNDVIETVRKIGYRAREAKNK